MKKLKRHWNSRRLRSCWRSKMKPSIVQRTSRRILEIILILKLLWKNMKVPCRRLKTCSLMIRIVKILYSSVDWIKEKIEERRCVKLLMTALKRMSISMRLLRSRKIKLSLMCRMRLKRRSNRRKLMIPRTEQSLKKNYLLRSRIDLLNTKRDSRVQKRLQNSKIFWMNIRLLNKELIKNSLLRKRRSKKDLIKHSKLVRLQSKQRMKPNFVNCTKILIRMLKKSMQEAKMVRCKSKMLYQMKGSKLQLIFKLK